MWALAWAAFWMGLVGGSHCLVMCAAPCSTLINSGTSSHGEQVITLVDRRGWRLGAAWRSLVFHGGRIAGYALVGALGAYAMERLAWFSQGTAALRPLWTAMHIAIIVWGLMMLLRLGQPAWMERAGRALWERVRSLINAPGGLLGIGCAWALMPCGFLYSAFFLAALSGGPTAGGVTMAAFAIGSGLWLWSGTLIWWRFKSQLQNPRLINLGTRFTGLVLVILGGIALWWSAVHQQAAPWCLP